jgi:POT family proton-dependent oligopeptide transporter
VPSKKVPGGIPYIIFNEAAERFSFYGMKGVLVVFMTSYLFLMPGAIGGEAMPEAAAIANYHWFTTAVYFTPIFGALLSDILFGKYMTIISLSLVYCAGHAALAFMGQTDTLDPGWMLFLGLGLISIGSGGIKPCVSAHVGDQFGKSNGHLLTKIYGWFYFSINVGAFLSTLLTPWLLEWYGPHWAFGVPGVLMAIATFLFWCGRKKFIHVPPGGLKWFRETFSWNGISTILKLGVIYVFVAMFWALFDQTGSSWVLQAEDLDRNWLGITWLSSQIQAVNPIMILTFIPLFAYIVYPLVNKVFTLTPIRKIAIGLFIMVIGFGMVSLVQGWIDAGEQPSIGWQVVAYAILTASEVMVSITCLEFSYTQAPRTMKSVIMALFLMSVSLGNLFTAGVNSAILVESSANSAKAVAAEFGAEHAAALEHGTKADGNRNDLRHRSHRALAQGMAYETMPGENFALVLAGVDGVLGSGDDIRMGFAPDGVTTGIIGQETADIKEAIGRVARFWETNDRLPNAQEGADIVGAIVDPWGQPLHYVARNRVKFHVVSEGPDKRWQSQFDIRAEYSVTSLTPKEHEDKVKAAASEDLLAWAHPKYNWLERRKAQMKGISLDGDGAGDAAGAGDYKNTLDGDIRWDIGGANTLAGASYFWFFTWIMLGTAILFVPVGYMYKPETHLQEEANA